eukprot:gene27680-27955_t
MQTLAQLVSGFRISGESAAAVEAPQSLQVARHPEVRERPAGYASGGLTRGGAVLAARPRADEWEEF